jgi:hypothetical protein
MERDGTIVPKKAPGRPPILGELDINTLLNNVQDNNCTTIQDITAKAPKPVSTSTGRRILHKNGLFYRVAVKRPRLQPRHAEERLAFSRCKQDWTWIDWERVVWTDESCFEIGKDFREIYLWR